MYLTGTSQIVSVLSLVLIAIDRYFAIVFPLKTTMMDQERVRFAFLLLTWIIAGAFCFQLYSTYNDIFSLLSHFESTKTPTD